MAERTGSDTPLGGKPPGVEGADGGPSGASPPAGAARRLRLPFRRKMDLLVVLPTVAMALLMTPVGVHEAGVASQWNSAASFLASTKSVSQLIQDLSLERDKAQAAMNGDPGKARAYNDAIGATDAQVLVVSKAFGAKATPTLTAALAAVSDLSYVRELPAREGLSQNYVVQAHVQQLVDSVYGAIDAQLVTAVDFAGHAAAGGPASALETELASLYAGDMAESQREASLTAFASEPSVYNAAEQYDTAIRMDEVATGELGFVSQFPAAADHAALTAVLRSPEAQTFREYQNQLAAAFGSAFQDVRGVISSPKNLDDLKTFDGRNTLTAAFETASNRRAATEAQITDRIIALSRSNAKQAEFTVGIMIGIGVLAAGALMALSALIRRSVVRPVLALTGAAGRVAKAAAADLERVTDEDLGAAGELPDFEAIPVPTDDELGDLAKAFNKVQETALLMLERQVTIRRNTAEMFGNVGHRIHNLTGRQLSIIDQVERTETDPVLLDRMYRIDHLAVRLQRGADSLILLSGERESNISGAPMRLTDVVRSAVGRVEGYQRVVLIAEDDAMVAPAAVSDLTLMVAELVENAVSFSPASQRVEIAVGLSARGFVIEIVDRGMGMSPEQMAQENARLVRRERLDLAPTRVLGLFVVGRLSVRTGVAVELSPTPGGGTTARVYVPGFLLAGPVDGAAGARGPRGDAAEAAATGTPAVAAGPAGNGVPALPGPSAAALMPGPHAQTQASTPVGSWPISAVAPAVGPDGLPRRVPGASQPSVESYGQPAT
ncbi:MAG: HAMP domain-containing protein, partial [Catenulisporales bacterium]|nr:HAMP domain-containing protein [Catenulisporales bacterium]